MTLSKKDILGILRNLQATLFVFSYKLRAYGRLIWRIVTICHRIPFKDTIYKHVCSNSNVFRQYYPEIFCDHRWKFQIVKIFSKGHVIVYSLGECPVFERLDFTAFHPGRQGRTHFCSKSCKHLQVND